MAYTEEASQLNVTEAINANIERIRERVEGLAKTIKQLLREALA